MAVFLTGASGFIGTHVLHQLLAAGYEVKAISRSGKLPHAPESDQLSVFEGDLLDSASYVHILEQCNSVIHLAGLISTHRKDEQEVMQANYETTKRLWQACKKTKPEKIVYLASIFAHGWAKDGNPIDEEADYDDEIYRLPNPYFKAKRDAELLSWQACEEGLPIVFGYPGFCIGPEDHRLSSMRAVVQAIKGEIPAFIDGGMNFIDVRDAAAGLIACLEKGKVGEKYLLVDHNFRWREFFSELEVVSGKRGPAVSIPYVMALWSGKALEAVWPGAPISEGDVTLMGNLWYYDPTRARAELGLPSRPLAESLRDSLDWLRENLYL